MSLLNGVINLVKISSKIYRLERRMRERGEHIMDDVRQQKLETIKWSDFIVY
jgi:hypothetical protein